MACMGASCSPLRRKRRPLGPHADAGLSQTIVEGSTIAFDGTNSTGPIQQYEWDLNGDGTFETFGPQAFLDLC